MGTSSDRQNIMLGMLERISEPIFFPKDDGNMVFSISNDLLVDRYHDVAPNVQRELAPQRPAMTYDFPSRKLPDLTEVYDIPTDLPWSVFIPKHRRAANRLVQLLLAEPDFTGFASLLGACRDRINRTMFVYALSAATLRRPELRGVRLPPIWEVLPDHFLSASTITRCEREAGLPSGSRAPIIIDREFTGTDLNPEHRVAYWREDLGLSAHHWHWHLAYPMDAVDRDRKGELFYYMHHQMVARYDTERLCNGLPRVRRLQNWDLPVDEGYFPKLTRENSGFVWGTRADNQALSDVNRPDYDFLFDLDDMRRWRDRIFEAIHMGFAIRQSGERVELTEERGTDILGDIIESSVLSVNPTLYGDMHNMGHVTMAFCHDPDGRHKEHMGVIGDNTTAVRDSIFFRWHRFVDDIFEEHKARLRPYTAEQLGFRGVEVTNVQVVTPNRPPNLMVTFWQQRDLDVTRGLDLRPFGRAGSVLVRFTHLQHEPYAFQINVRNNRREFVEGTVRVFIAVQRSENGQRLRLQDQRLMFIELDKFQQRLEPGDNAITRRSDQSSVTIPFEQTFRELRGRAPPEATPQNPAAGLGSEQQYCGCGWPDHLLLPRGTTSGMAFDLFVMVSNYRDDQVQLRNRGASTGGCRSSVSYCGLRDDLYPDRRAMGYPFDRRSAPGINAVGDYQLGNMRVAEVRIQHEDRTIFRA